MIRGVISLLAAVAVPTALAVQSALVAVSQDPTRAAHVQLLDTDSGEVSVESALSFPFSMPYVQMTCDVASGTSYLTAFPDGASYPSLYVLDRSLAEVARFEHGDFTWWDLQAAPRQTTLYGIMVTEDFNGGMYGRTLSNYSYTVDTATGTARLDAQQLYTLPYMWYVNASSIDQATSTYYALVNNFPGKENSTTEQKLVVGAFGHAMATTDPTDSEEAVAELDLDLGSVMAQFVAYSGATGELFFAGPSKDGTHAATVGVICTEHGKVERVLFEQSSGVAAVGPLVSDEKQGRLLFFLQRESDAAWVLMSVGHAEGSKAEEVATYSATAYRAMGAAVHMLVE